MRIVKEYVEKADSGMDKLRRAKENAKGPYPWEKYYKTSTCPARFVSIIAVVQNIADAR